VNDCITVAARGCAAMWFYLQFPLRLYHDKRAVTALEYAIIAGIIVTTIVVGFTSLGDALSSKFNNIGGSIQ
jgi:Flp pilus assembly pilin Flp